MNFTYETQGTNTYLVYTMPADANIDSMSLGMLTNNKIPGLADTLFTQMDSTKYVKYNVSAKIPVSQFFAGAVNKKRLLGVFRGIVDAILSAEDYMLDENSILLNLEYIFADVTTCETVLVCLPVVCEGKKQDLGAFFKGLMFSTQFDQTESCDHVAKIINYLNSSPLFSLRDFGELLETIEKGQGNVTAAVQQEQPKVTQQAVPQASVEKDVIMPVQMQQTLPQSQVQMQPQSQEQPRVQPSSGAKSMGTVPSRGAEQPQKQMRGLGTKQQSAPQTDNSGKGKGFSLFGLFSSKPEKKETKQAQTKQLTRQPTKMSFDVPGAQSTKTSFDVPGAQPTKRSFDVPGQAAPVTPQTAVPQQQSKPMQHIQMTKHEPKTEAVATYAEQVQSVQSTNNPISFGETTNLSEAIGATTVLNGGSEKTRQDPHLIRIKNNERILLNKPSFRIGKERSFVDYFISDNTAISRSHANIVNRDGEFFVMDTNSTNHTYVNGGMIQPNVEVRITHGTKIRFANEDFEFRLY